MEDRIRRLYEMILRVLGYMTANAAAFRNVPFIAPTVAALQIEADTLGGLGASKVTATAASRDSTISRGDARQEVHDDLEYLAEVWRSIPDETAGMENKFRLPRGSNDQTWIAAARSHADEAAEPEVAAILDQHNIEAAFFTALRAKADTFEQAINTAEAKRGERVGTNAAFNDPARRGKKLVDKLNPAVKRHFRDDPQKLAEWLIASHVERAPKPKPKEEPQAVTGNPDGEPGES